MTNESQALVRSSSTDELALRPTYSIEVLVERQERITEVMKKLMREGEHYGKIPGCGDKPTLLKPGAEKLNAAFGLAPTFSIERRDLANGHREYEIVCTLVSIGTGVAVGQGIGSCSTMESRYRWRKGERTCPECGKQGSVLKSKNPDEGYFCWRKKDGCGATFAPGDRSIEGQEAGRVENPDIADTYNTVLKIAKKRAQVDATLTAVGASDLLTQDLEDLGPGEEREPARRESTTRQGGPAEPALEPSEDWIIDMIGRIDDAGSVADLKRLTPTIQKMTPAGSSSRRACKGAYDERLAKLTGGQR